MSNLARNDGMALEEEVFGQLTRMLEGGDLGLPKHLCKLHRRKSYFSPSRGAEIDFENVIEFFLPANFDQPDAQPALVLFFECKDHTTRNVEVGKIDEVIGRLNAPLGFQMKAYVVTRKGFAATAIRTAKTKGIGLIKIMPDDKVEFVAYFMTPDLMAKIQQGFARRTMQALQDPDYIAKHESWYGLDNSYVFSSLDQMILELLKSHQLTREYRNN